MARVVLVCGGRDYTDRERVYRELDYEHAQFPISMIINGSAAGADKFGWDWAIERGVPTEGYSADWNVYGRRAGPMRNQMMLDHGKPELVIAFPSKSMDAPGSKNSGTADMIRRAGLAGVPVKKIERSGS